MASAVSSEREPTRGELEQLEQDDQPLREEDVTVADRLDDRVQEGDGLEESPMSD